MNEISVYPNPASSTIIITRSGNDPFTIEIFNNIGQRMKVAAANISERSLDVSGLPAGIYFVHITANGNTQTRTIVVRR